MPHRPALLCLIAVVLLTLPACSRGGPRAGTAAPGEQPPPAGPPAAAPREVPAKYRDFQSELYAKEENWMCRPDLPAARDDCLQADLDTTVIEADGRASVVKSVPLADPSVDCFYIYPTVPTGAGVNFPNDLALAADKSGEVAVLTFQFARFREVCAPYAPLYRQVAFAAIFAPEAARAATLAYADVRDAFAYYMAHFNRGRPFILVGHSQGALLLSTLLRLEVDNDADLRSRLVAAYLIGGRVGVPPGEDVGGDLQNIPLCRAADQTGCVVAYSSYAVDAPPTGADRFGRTMGGTVAGCVNPAAPAGGRATLSNSMPSAGVVTPAGRPVTTPWVSMPGAIAGECVQRDGFSYLEIGAAPRPGDRRDPRPLVRSVPGWGLHLTEVNLTLGDLLELARRQSRAFHP